MRKEDEEEELEALHLPICQKILSHVGCFGRVIEHVLIIGRDSRNLNRSYFAQRV